MGIVSYAQNFEDVMIWRSLRHITSGFYIDVGAQDPLVDSVSRAFHDQGWRGIHVEPVSKYAALLRRHRPGDEVIEAVVGEAQGLVPFFLKLLKLAYPLQMQVLQADTRIVA